MSIQNLAIVFGPTLFGQQASGLPGGQSNGGPAMADAGHQNKVTLAISVILQRCLLTSIFIKAVETILEHYNDIFVDESESA